MDDAELARRRARDAVLSGASARGPRAEIAASWRRVAAVGLDPSGNAEIAPLPGVELAHRRQTSALAALVPRLVELLRPVVDAGQLVVITDHDGRVLWRSGRPGVRRMADALGFVDGSAWTEGNVGTNAIGTALVLGAPVAIKGAEHFVDSHAKWGCAAAPITDPWTGATLGVVDVSGPSRGLHPAELALVEMAARVCSLEVLERHHAVIERLRSHAAPLLARVGGKVLVVDHHGHLAAATGVQAPGRITLPGDMTVGRIWIPTMGAAVAEALPGGWLLRLADDESPPTTLELDLSGEPEVKVLGEASAWSRRLSPRHAEILVALVRAGAAGRSAAELAEDLFADASRVVTVRAELSRLRRDVGSVLLARPYRVAPGIDVRLTLPTQPAALLPGSSAPVVVALRGTFSAPPAPTGTGGAGT